MTTTTLPRFLASKLDGAVTNVFLICVVHLLCERNGSGCPACNLSLFSDIRYGEPEWHIPVNASSFRFVSFRSSFRIKVSNVHGNHSSICHRRAGATVTDASSTLFRGVIGVSTVCLLHRSRVSSLPETLSYHDVAYDTDGGVQRRF